MHPLLIRKKVLKIKVEEKTIKRKRANKFSVSQSCVGYALRRLDVAYKNPLVHPKANKEKRILFKNRIAKYKEEGCSIVYIDESGFVHDMPRTHGYSTVGHRYYATQDWNAKGRTNVISYLSGDSLIGCGIVNTNVDTDVFNTWGLKKY